jgi:hypothetical protein
MAEAGAGRARGAGRVDSDPVGRGVSLTPCRIPPWRADAIAVRGDLGPRSTANLLPAALRVQGGARGADLARPKVGERVTAATAPDRNRRPGASGKARGETGPVDHQRQSSILRFLEKRRRTIDGRWPSCHLNRPDFVPSPGDAIAPSKVSEPPVSRSNPDPTSRRCQEDFLGQIGRISIRRPSRWCRRSTEGGTSAVTVVTAGDARGPGLGQG